MFKWLRREEKQKKEKNRMRMNGKGMKRVLNDLEHRERVEPGMMFVDEKHGRDLVVLYRAETVDGWLCRVSNKPDTLFFYSDTFILKHRKFAI